MSSLSAVLKNDGPLCIDSVEARRQAIHFRGLRQLRIRDPFFTLLNKAVDRGEMGIILSPSKNSKIWAMPDADGHQHTIGILDHSNGCWRASGWAAEHFVCITAGVPMPSLEENCLFLKPRVRRMILGQGSKCCLCNRAMPLDDITVEHWLAKSLGGDSRPENLKLAHRACNELAGSKTIREKLTLRQQLCRMRATSLHQQTPMGMIAKRRPS